MTHRTLSKAAYDAIIDALEAAREYTQERVTKPRLYGHDRQTLRLDCLVADALELIDEQDAAA